MTWINSRLNEQGKNQPIKTSANRCDKDVHFTVLSLREARVVDLLEEKKIHEVKARNLKHILQEKIALHYWKCHGWALEEANYFVKGNHDTCKPVVGSKRKRKHI